MVPAAPRRRHRQAVALAGVLTIVGTVMAMAVWYAAPFWPDGERVARPVADDEQVDDEPERAPQPVADPASVHIVSQGIEAETIALGTRDDGSLEVPGSAHTAGWWAGGPAPGERGASVIVGHVDSRDGPGAFFGLADVDAGERLTVKRIDGSSVHFRVERVEIHAKDAFPTASVYGHTDVATLRLITCTGTFDPAARSYEDNLIVFAELEAEDADVGNRSPVKEASPAERPAAAGVPAATSEPDTRRGPVGLAALSVIGTAAAVTRQALRSRQASSA